jgi:carbamoyl-phosphate synthase large subunit
MKNEKKDVVRIMLTGAGAPGTVGTIYSLDNNPAKKKVWILGTDIQKECVGEYFCNDFETVCEPEDPKYPEMIKKLCRKHQINVLIPQTTREVKFFSEHKGDFNNVLVGHKSAVSFALDKDLVGTVFCDILSPNYHSGIRSKEDLFIAAKDLGYPKKTLVIKPARSNGSRGVRIVKKPKRDFQSYVSTKPGIPEVSLEHLSIQLGDEYPEGLILMEYLPGKEYSVDCFKGKDFKIAISRERTKIVNGIAFETKIDRIEDLESECLKAMREMDLTGLAGFQFIQNEKGMFKVIECNPRVQGTMVASTLAGRNIIWNAVEETLYGKTKEQRGGVKSITVGRYWGAYSSQGVV